MIEESPTDKDIQMGLRQTLVNIQTIQKEIMKDMQVISPEQQAEYEKELVREKLEQDKEKAGRELSQKEAADIENSIVESWEKKEEYEAEKKEFIDSCIKINKK